HAVQNVTTTRRLPRTSRLCRPGQAPSAHRAPLARSARRPAVHELREHHRYSRAQCTRLVDAPHAQPEETARTTGASAERPRRKSSSFPMSKVAMKVILLAGAMLAMMGAANAANITPRCDNKGCSVFLAGEIKSGDDKKFHRIVASLPNTQALVWLE